MAEYKTHQYNTRFSKMASNTNDLNNNDNKNKHKALQQKYKKEESSDESSDDLSDGSYISEDEDDFIVEDNKKLNQLAFQSLLSGLFPSKYTNDKYMSNKYMSNKHMSNKNKHMSNKNKHNNNMFNNNKKNKHFTPPRECSTPKECSSPTECCSTPTDCCSTPTDCCSSPKKTSRRSSTFNLPENKYKVEESSPAKFNIIFTIKPTSKVGDDMEDDSDDMEDDSDNDDDYDPDDDMEYEEDDDDYDPDDDEGDEDDEDDSDYDPDEDMEDMEDDDEMDDDNIDEMTIDKDISNISDATKYINELPELQKSNPVIKNVMKNLRNKEQKAFKQQERVSKKKKYKNTLKFRELLQQKNVMNDLNYFQEKMTVEQQEKVLLQMAELKALVDIEKPYRLSLLEASIPPRFKACAYNKLSTLKNMEPGCSEYNKVKHWVDDFMRIPFNKLNHLPVRIEDGIDKCHEFMENAKNTLDKAVYGLNDVKLQVMQMVGQWITNPDAIGNSIAIEGPPGTGKTTLVKEGISKILNREFVFIPLGGATDSSCLEGHSYTYEGSNCGLIVKQLIQCQSMNPIIYFDELDKISDTPKGEEIVGILTHLTDTSQNSKFHDKYFAEFDFDLSRCVFFFSYNDRSKVNRILLDRMHCIMTKGYELPQKAIIAKDYLLPIIREQVRFKFEDIILPEETINHIINTHTNKEDGVRNLKRCLEIIHTKLNLYRLMKPDTNLFESDMSIKVEFPITITPKIVDKLIKKMDGSDSGAWKHMYM